MPCRRSPRHARFGRVCTARRVGTWRADPGRRSRGRGRRRGRRRRGGRRGGAGRAGSRGPRPQRCPAAYNKGRQSVSPGLPGRCASDSDIVPARMRGGAGARVTVSTRAPAGAHTCSSTLRAPRSLCRTCLSLFSQSRPHQWPCWRPRL